MKPAFNPTITTIFILFLLPIYTIKLPLSKSISINLLEIILTIVITSNFFLAFSKSHFLEIKRHFNKNKEFFLSLFLITTGFLISFVYNQRLNNWQNWSDSFGKLLDLLILPILFSVSSLFLQSIKYHFIDRSKTLPPFLKLLTFFPIKLTALLSYFLSATLISFVGIFFWLTHHLTFDNRLTVFFDSPNQLAMFLSPAIIIGISFLFMQFNQKASLSFRKYWLLYIALISLCFNVFLSQSLGSQLSLILPIIILASSHNITSNFLIKKVFIFFHRYYPQIIFSLLTISTFFIINSSNFLRKINYQPNIPPTSIDSRLTIYQVDQKILKNNWLWGIGSDNFQKIYLDYQKYFPFYPQWAVPHAHNNLIHFWLEGGILAFIGLLLIYKQILTTDTTILPIPNLTSSQKKQPSTKNKLSPVSIFQLILIYFILHGIIDVSIWTPATATLFWFTTTYLLLKHNHTPYPTTGVQHL